MPDGILDFVGFAATVALAIPVALLGVLKLGEGDLLLGVVFLAIAAGMVAVEEWLTTPGDLPLLAAQRLTGRVVDEPSDDE
ncbi:hypothetical protein ACKVMT_08365 [Halobacteriales archaeon Cl-PHB]